MTPRVKHVYKPSNHRIISGARNHNLAIPTKIKANGDSDNNKRIQNSRSRATVLSSSPMILQSLRSENVRTRQEAMQRMRGELQVRERKILQDLTNFRGNQHTLQQPRPFPSLLRTLEMETTGKDDLQSTPLGLSEPTETILPPDINTTTIITNRDFSSMVPTTEMPSFMDSPMMKISSEDDLFGALKGMQPEKKAIVKVKSSSPSKVPEIWEFSDNGGQHNDNVGVDMEVIKENSSAMASPVSEKSIPRTPLELDESDMIEFFTIDPEYLKSFEGIWCRRLRRPISCSNPENSPDHFEKEENKRKKSMKK